MKKIYKPKIKTTDPMKVQNLNTFKGILGKKKKKRYTFKHQAL